MLADAHAMSLKRLIIVGGSGGGASAALRARRLNEDLEILVFERGPHLSLANNALPAFADSELLTPDPELLPSPAQLKAQENIEVRPRSVVLGIDREHRQIEVCEVDTECRYHESYDALLLSTTAAPIRPRLPGVDREGLFVVRQAADLERCLHWIRDYQASRAVIIGPDPVGLAIAEQFKRRGLWVDLVSATPSLFARLDPEMAALAHAGLRSHGLNLYLGQEVVAFEPASNSQPARAGLVALADGTRLPADIVILALGSRPETGLARVAGIAVGNAGGLRVDEHFRTSDPQIWAVGEAIELTDPITGENFVAPWGCPTSRHGRLAAEAILGQGTPFGGFVRSGCLRLFQSQIGFVGATEASLLAAGRRYDVHHWDGCPHRGYRPAAGSLHLRVLSDADTGAVLGGQLIGTSHVENSLDALTTALHARLTLEDLAALDFPHHPPHGTGQSPLNQLARQGLERRRQEYPTQPWSSVQSPGAGQLLDLREAHERTAGMIPKALQIPASELRQRVEELPRKTPLLLFCATGEKSAAAAKFLAHRGFPVSVLEGGFGARPIFPT